METGVYWRFGLPKEVQRRTIRGSQAVNDLISINLLEVMALIRTAYVIIDMRGESSPNEGVSQLISTGMERLEWSETTRSRSFRSKLFVSISNFQATEQPTRTENSSTDFCGGTAQLDPKTGAITWAASVLTQKITSHANIAQGKPQRTRC